MKCYVLHEVCDYHSVEFVDDVIVIATSSVLHHSYTQHPQDLGDLLSVFPYVQGYPVCGISIII